MIMNMKKRILSVFLTFTMVLAMLPGFGIVARAQDAVSYRYPEYNTADTPSSGIKAWHEDGSCTEYTKIESSKTDVQTWTDGWYVVSGSSVNFSAGLVISGDVKLILKDGCSLNVTGVGHDDGNDGEPAITINENSGLTVYVQSAGTGEMNITGGQGGNTSSEISGNGGKGILIGSNASVTVRGGVVNIYGGEGCYDDGNGGDAINGNSFTVDDGSVKAEGGIADCMFNGCGMKINTLTVNGGSLTATGKPAIDCNSMNLNNNLYIMAGDSEDSLKAVQEIDKEGYVKIEAAAASVTSGSPENTINYKTLSEAWSAAQTAGTATVQLLTDVTSDLTVPSGKNITLDLNGHVLKGSGKNSVIKNYGTLTVQDSGSKVHYFKVVASGLWELQEDFSGTEDYTFDTANGLKKNGEATTDIPEADKIIAVSGGCITGGIGSDGGGFKYGAGIFNFKDLSLTGGNIIGNNSQRSVVCIKAEGATFQMTGGAVIGNYEQSYGAVLLDNGSFVMDSGRIAYNTNSSSYSGAGVHIGGQNNTFTMNGGSIDHNKTSGDGGGIAVTYGNVFTMNDGCIERNLVGSSSCGGGIWSAGTFIMHDGSITDSTAANGGGVYTLNGSFVIDGGEISGNTAANCGGGLYVASGTVTVGGTAEITGNYKEEKDNNLYLSSGVNIGVGDGTDTHTYKEGSSVKNVPALTSGADIGVMLKNNTGTFTGTASENDAQYFCSDNENYSVKFNTDHLELVAAYVITNDTPESAKNTNHGYVTVGKSACAGATVNITATPDGEYLLDAVTIKKTSDGSDVTNAVNYNAAAGNFTMPAYAVTVSATFKPQHTHSWSYMASGATITATCGNSDGGHSGSTSETLTIVKPEHAVYGDGKSAEATIKDSKTTLGGLTVATSDIEYEGVSPTAYEKCKTAPAAAGSYKASISVGSGDDAKTAYVEYTIEKKQLTVTGTTADGKSYDGKTDATVHLGTVNGIIAGDEVTVSASGTFADKDAGNGKDVMVSYTLEGKDAANYTIQDSETIADIEPAGLTVSGSSASNKNYDGTTSAVATKGSLSGVISGDDVAVEVQSAEFESKDAGNDKSVTIEYKLTGSDASNYTVSSVQVSASILPKSISVQAEDKTSRVGSALVPLTYIADALCSGDSFTGELSTDADKDVVGNTYTITQGTLSAGDNYSIQFTAGTYTVNPDMIAVTVGEEVQYVAYNGLVTRPADPVCEGYTFGGWYMDEIFTNAWNFANDRVTEPMTLYAKWIKNSEKKAVVTGKVTDDSSTPAENAVVELMLGTEKVAAANTNTDGTYTFDNVEIGRYNIVVTKEGKTKTTAVNVNSVGKFNAPSVKMPAGNVNSKVEVKENASTASAKADVASTVVGGVDTIAEKEKPSAGDKVTIVLTIEPKAEDTSDETQTEIKKEAGSKTVEFVDFTLTKQENDDTPINIGDSNNELLTITLPFDTTGINVSSITVYRHHSKAAALKKISSEKEKVDGTFMVGDGVITIYASKFSTYAIGYTKTSSSGGGGGGSSVSTYAVTMNEAVHGSVAASTKSTSAGSTVTLTVTPDKGYTLETITVTDKNDKEVTLTPVTDGEKYTFQMPSSAVTVKAVFAEAKDDAVEPAEQPEKENAFVDVTSGDYFYEPVLWSAENGITDGVDATHFAPNDATTRAQMVTFLWRAAGSPEPTAAECKFTDVKADAYYYKAVLWAVENGITDGMNETSFGSDANVSRCQTVTFLWRYNGKPAVTAENPFTDVASDAYYYDAVLWAKAQGIVEGTSDTTFSPDADCTRGQIVTILYRNATK